MVTKRLMVWLILVSFLLIFLAIPLAAQVIQSPQIGSLAPDVSQQGVASGPRIIEFAGRQWIVKSGCGRGPGPNCWSDSKESVWVESGQLHLKIREVNNTWHAAEVYTEACTKYGRHRFSTVTRLDSFDPNVVAALFLYRNDETEIDIEFSK